MLSDEVLDKVIERLANRIEQGNEYVLEQIAKKVKKIGTLTPTQAQQLEQVFKYGGDYNKIVKKLAKITKINIKDINKMFREVAKSDYQFAKQFYDYRGKKYIPFDENRVLQEQLKSISQLTTQKYAEFARSDALGFSVRNQKGQIIQQGLKQTYDDAIDKAVLSVSQGKTTFEDEMYRMLKELGTSGIKTLDYAGRTIRLDSAIRMHLNDALNQLHNETVMNMAQDYGADGVEITVLSNPAPDHQYVQGRQFSEEEFNKFQNDEDAVSYDGKSFPATSEETGYDRRSISQYNCRHKIYPIVLGVSKPKFNDKQLQKIIDDNNKGFDFEGKHYTNYEGSQLQRKLERKIREQKDLQILGRAGDNKKLAQESQLKINQLTKKYNKLCKESGLPSYTERMRVSGYSKIKTSDDVINKWNKKFGKKYGSFDVLNGNVPYNDKLENWVSVSEDLRDIDVDVLDQSLAQVEKIYDKYNLTNQGLSIERGKSVDGRRAIAYTQGGNRVFLTAKMKDADVLKAKIIQGVNTNNYTRKIKDGTELIYPITHEMGHIIENRLLDNKHGPLKDIIDNEIKNNIIKNVSARNGMTREEIIEQFFSGYAKSKDNYEWFAESFAELQLGYKNIWIEEFEKWLMNS